MSETEGRKLHGAAAAAAAKKAEAKGAPIADFIADLEQRVEHARQDVETKREALAQAEAHLGVLEGYLGIKMGTHKAVPIAPTATRRAPATGGMRAPRAAGRELQAKIKETLKGSADGKPVAELIKEIGGDGQRLRNQLAQLVKKGEIARHSSGLYSLPV